MRILGLYVLLLLSNIALAEANQGEWIANSIIKRYTPTIDAMTLHGWDHSNSAIVHGIEKVTAHSPTPFQHYVSRDKLATV